MHAADTRFYTAYILSARLFKCRSAGRQTVVAAEWERWGKKQGNREKAAAVKGIVLDDDFWAAIKLFCRLVKPIVRLMRLVDSNMPTMGKVRAPICSCDDVNTSDVLSLTGYNIACRCTPCVLRSSSTYWM